MLNPPILQRSIVHHQHGGIDSIAPIREEFGVLGYLIDIGYGVDVSHDRIDISHTYMRLGNPLSAG